MKALLQRVNGASVVVDGEIVGKIGAGLVVFIGIANDDSFRDAQYLVQKIVELRIFSNETGRFDYSIRDIKGELMLVSQFTLLADTQRGRRPSFTGAAPPGEAERLFNCVVEEALATGLRVATGRFQQYMQVEIHNDGPVTILLDSAAKK